MTEGTEATLAPKEGAAPSILTDKETKWWYACRLKPRREPDLVVEQLLETVAQLRTDLRDAAVASYEGERMYPYWGKTMGHKHGLDLDD